MVDVASAALIRCEQVGQYLLCYVDEKPRYLIDAQDASDLSDEEITELVMELDEQEVKGNA